MGEEVSDTINATLSLYFHEKEKPLPFNKAGFYLLSQRLEKPAPESASAFAERGYYVTKRSSNHSYSQDLKEI